MPAGLGVEWLNRKVNELAQCPVYLGVPDKLVNYRKQFNRDVSEGSLSKRDERNVRQTADRGQ